MSETMYNETLKSKDPSARARLSQAQSGCKVNRICDAFLAVLQQPQYKEDYIQNIITAHVCKVPADLEAGLRVIGRLQGESALGLPYGDGLIPISCPRYPQREGCRAYLLSRRRQPALRYIARHLQPRTCPPHCTAVPKGTHLFPRTEIYSNLQPRIRVNTFHTFNPSMISRLCAANSKSTINWAAEPRGSSTSRSSRPSTKY